VTFVRIDNSPCSSFVAAVVVRDPTALQFCSHFGAGREVLAERRRRLAGKDESRAAALLDPVDDRVRVGCRARQHEGPAIQESRETSADKPGGLVKRRIHAGASGTASKRHRRAQNRAFF